MREQVIQKIAGMLRERGFVVSTFLHTNSCFDIIAKSPIITLIIKVFENVDSLRDEHAEELKKIEGLFGAHVLIIGRRSKFFMLKQGTTYDRYGLPVVALRTFREILDEKIPFVKYYKGKNIVELDREKLHQKRLELGLSLADIAEQLKIAKETLYRFETGHHTTIETGEKLEKFFKCPIIKRTNPLEKPFVQPVGQLYDEEIKDDVLARVRDLGLKLAVFSHAPFDAYSMAKAELLITKGRHMPDLEKKAEELSKARDVLGKHSMIIAKGSRQKSILHTPIIEIEELETMRKAKDLLKLIREREKNGQ